ncbi:MAG TPA: YceI family protein [Pedobacter sp.]|jgi:hypothetical protein
MSGFNVQVSKPHITRWVITKGCFLKVGGSTNVNKFNCVIANYSTPDTLSFFRGNSSSPIKVLGNVKLNVQQFDCHNPVMTSDLRKTLKVKEFPNLVIRFISLNKYPDNNTSTEALNGIVTIELAGVSRRFNVAYKLIKNGSNALTMVGTRQVTFSDFNIVPPRKIGGMIKTNDELDVVFNLNVEILN